MLSCLSDQFRGLQYVLRYVSSRWQRATAISAAARRRTKNPTSVTLSPRQRYKGARGRRPIEIRAVENGPNPGPDGAITSPWRPSRSRSAHRDESLKAVRHRNLATRAAPKDLDVGNHRSSTRHHILPHATLRGRCIASIAGHPKRQHRPVTKREKWNTEPVPK